MLMVGKVLESFQRVGSGKIQSASRAEEAGVTTFGAFIHQGWAGNRSRRQLSQMVILCKNCTLAGLSSQQNRKTGPNRGRRREEALVLYIQRKKWCYDAKTKVVQIAARYDTLETR